MVSLVGSQEDRGGLVYLQTPGARRLAAVSPVVSVSVSGITGGESGGSWRSGVFTDARSVAASSGQPSCQCECEWYHWWGVGRIVAVWCIYRRQERGG